MASALCLAACWIKLLTKLAYMPCRVVLACLPLLATQPSMSSTSTKCTSWPTGRCTLMLQGSTSAPCYRCFVARTVWGVGLQASLVELLGPCLLMWDFIPPALKGRSATCVACRLSLLIICLPWAMPRESYLLCVLPAK